MKGLSGDRSERARGRPPGRSTAVRDAGHPASRRRCDHSSDLGQTRYMADPSIWTLVVPPASALAGVALTRLFDVYGEKRRWRRDQGARSYADFIVAADALVVELSNPSDDMDWLKRAQTSFLTMTRAGAMLDIFGSVGATRTAHELWNLANDLLYDWQATIQLGGDQWTAVAQGYRAKLLELTNEARKDIGDDSRVTLTFQPSPPAS